MKIKIPALAVLWLIIAALLAASQTQSLARSLRAPSQSSDDPSRSVWDGVYTDGQAERGHSLYHENCENCHGTSLVGEGEASPLAGAQFLSSWNGLTVGDLFERVRTTMPLNDPGRLSAQQNADILAYILSFNIFPAGKTVLPHKVELLKEIRIEATKPDNHNAK